MPQIPDTKVIIPRLSDTGAGKTLSILLALFYAALATTSTGGEWYTLFLPACLLGVAMILFCICSVQGYKIPSPGWAGWLAIGIGGGYFFIRAWYSPWMFESLSDMGLIIISLMMFMTGVYAGAGKGRHSIVPFLAAALGLLNGLMLGQQEFMDSHSSWFRPDFALSGTEINNIGLFGYKNFCGHFFSITGFFLCSYSLASPKKWGAYLILGLVLVILSCACNSRAAAPNALIGVTLCFFIYTASVFRNNKKFYVAGILFFLLLFLAMAYALLDLSSGAGTLASTLDIFSFGSRIELSRLAWSLADSAPWIGHGSQMFTNLATEFFAGANVPNFAHHEYAQAACDYGYVGLGLMLGLIGLFMILGFFSVLKLADDQKTVNPLGPASFCVLCMAAVHAYGEFIWHNPALIGASALCCGMICTSAAKKVKASQLVGKWAQGMGAATLAGLCLWYAWTAFPVWKASLYAQQASPSAPLSSLKSAAMSSHDPDLTRRYILHTLDRQTRPARRELLELNQMEECARAISPGNHALAAAQGLLYMYLGEYAAAERVLRPYVKYPDRFDDRMFAWSTTYINNLYAWSIATANRSPGQALSMAREAERLLSPGNNRTRFYGMKNKAVTAERKKRASEVTMLIMILQSSGAVPDHTWQQ